MIFLSSFQRARYFPGQKYSVARFKPRDCEYPELDFFAATGPKGEPLNPHRMRGDNRFAVFEKALMDGYRSRWKRINEFLSALSPDQDIVMACWCPYSKDTLKELQDTGMFHCHTGLIGKVINIARPDIDIVFDRDRAKLAEAWRPGQYVQMEI